MIAVEVNKCRPRFKLPIVAWLIMLFQGMLPWKKTSWSHMSISYTSITGNKKFIDATGAHGVTERIASRYAKKYVVIDSILFLIDANEIQFQHWVESQEGKSYDHGQLVGLALKLLGFFSVNTLGSNMRKLTCNELILSFLNEFKSANVLESDNYDLLMTWNLARRLS